MGLTRRIARTGRRKSPKASRKARPPEFFASVKEILEKALFKAGEILRRSINAPKKIGYKKVPVNLVTEADRESQKIILRIVQKRFPEHSILAEESPPSGNSRYKWIIDPLDGTTNFAHSFPIASVSIAFEKDGDVVMGGVFDPFRDELFFAEKGTGAFLNGKRIRVSRVPKLSRSLLVTGFPYDRSLRAREYLQIYEAFMVKCHGVRRTGSAAVDLCYVACGRFDGFWEQKLHPWDTAAASLIVEEASGSMSDFRGSSHTIYGYETLASNGLIHSQMLKILRLFVNR